MSFSDDYTQSQNTAIFFDFVQSSTNIDVAQSISDNSDQELSQPTYIPIRSLGGGAFGEAVLYKRVEDDALVVWKEVNLKKLSDGDKHDSEVEIEILSSLSHPNIVAYFNHFIDGSMLLIEMEYANGGSLHDKITQQKSFFAENVVSWYFIQLISAVAYMHNRCIIHRDIKTLNIFMTKSDLVKLGDFGISKILSAKEELAVSYVGTPYYMSPEIIKGDLYGVKSDIWSCGCVLYELLALKRVFEASNPLKLATDIVTNNIGDIDPIYSRQISQILKDTMSKEACDRPSANDLLNHQYFKPFNERLEALTHESSTISRLTSRSMAEGNDIIPTITSKISEVYIWGGGKCLPQKLEGFCKGQSALQVSCSKNHFAVVSIERELFTWAASQGQQSIQGQLGHGDSAAYKLPKKVEVFYSIPIKLVACGEEFTACVTDEGQLYMFGSDYHGCLGVGGAMGDRCLAPNCLEFFSENPVSLVTCGSEHVVVLTVSNEVYTWGNGEHGRLGLGDEDNRNVPNKVEVVGQQRILNIFAGKDGTMLLTDAGKLLATGLNEDNKLGLNYCIKGVVTKEVSFDIHCELNFKLVKSLIKYKIRSVSLGSSHTAAIDASRRIITFGCNKFGQLGRQNNKPYPLPCVVGGPLVGKKMHKVACGDGFTVAATLDNMLYSWGQNTEGRLGVQPNVDLNTTGGQSQFSGYPRPIFGSLHMVSNISCSYWNSIIIAEQVLAQKTINSLQKNSIILNDLVDDVSSFVGFTSFNNDVIMSSSSMSSSCMTNQDTLPPWLKQELQDGEFIPASPKLNADSGAEIDEETYASLVAENDATFPMKLCTATLSESVASNELTMLEGRGVFAADNDAAFPMKLITNSSLADAFKSIAPNELGMLEGRNVFVSDNDAAFPITLSTNTTPADAFKSVASNQLGMLKDKDVLVAENDAAFPIKLYTASLPADAFESVASNELAMFEDKEVEGNLDVGGRLEVAGGVNLYHKNDYEHLSRLNITLKEENHRLIAENKRLKQTVDELLHRLSLFQNN